MIILKTCLNKYFPEKIKYTKIKALTKPYINNDIKTLIREKKKLKKKSKGNTQNHIWRVFQAGEESSKLKDS